MKIKNQPLPSPFATTETFVVCYFQDKISHSFHQLHTLNSEITNTLLEKKQINSNLGHTSTLLGHEGLIAPQIIIVGCGKESEFNEESLNKVIKAIIKENSHLSSNKLAVILDDLTPKHRDTLWSSTHLSKLFRSGSYQYTATKTQNTEESDIPLNEVILFSVNTDASLETHIAQGLAIASGMNLAKELGNLPANICDPNYLASTANQIADQSDLISCEILEEDQLKELGMGAFIAVSQGSHKGGKIIILNYQGGNDQELPHVLVGKGLTFDSGGISLKPASGMEEMKWDMLGAASVLGVLQTLSELKPKINVIGVIATAENMISGQATRPGDIVTCMNGKTVEIINTDAEGRLVLCDTLTYIEKFKPASVIDIATLTGAAVIALGHEATAVYSNTESLQKTIIEAGEESWDRGWPMPLWDNYKEDLKSPYADLRNVGTRAGGSITAAIYLSYFTENYPWAHLDIAGTGWKSAKEGATGRPVALLVHYLLNQIN